MNTWLKGVKILWRTQDERPEKSNDQGLTAIYETIKSRPVGCDFTIKKRVERWMAILFCVWPNICQKLMEDIAEETIDARALFFCRA